MKRKMFSILFALVLVLSLALVTVAPVSAQGGWGGKHATTVELDWEEEYTMYQPDGTLVGSWTYPVGPVAFQMNPESETYRTTDMEAFLGGGVPAEDILGGFIMINRNGKLHGKVTYISGRSDVECYQVFEGQVEVTLDSDTGTMEGTYSDRLYARGTEEEILNGYSFASPVRIGHSDLWFIWYGDYEVSAP